jgi:hypothetical protein
MWRSCLSVCLYVCLQPGISARSTAETTLLIQYARVSLRAVGQFRFSAESTHSTLRFSKFHKFSYFCTP